MGQVALAQFEWGGVLWDRSSGKPWVNPSCEPDAPAYTCLSTDLGPGPPFGGEHRPFDWGWRAVGLCSPCLRWWGRLCRAAVRIKVRATSALSWCGGGGSLGGNGKHVIISRVGCEGKGNG